ncbi:MAG: cell division protein ZapA [Spirochaetaceae bacterium]|nr:MAG: cell division protein ZapA [Spirochaetaceae bacterium]
MKSWRKSRHRPNRITASSALPSRTSRPRSRQPIQRRPTQTTTVRVPRSTTRTSSNPPTSWIFSEEATLGAPMKIELLGASFVVQTDEDPEHLKDLVDYLKTKIQEVRSSVSTTDPLKLAILSALLTTDELFKERTLQRRQLADSQQVEEITQRILDQLESSLSYRAPE